MAETLRVKGLRELMRATARAQSDTRREVRASLREVGDVVRDEAERLFAVTDERSARGYRTRVRQRGVSVEQSLRKTTGTRPDYGALQMRRALVPAVSSKEGEIEDRMERALDRVADRFER